jgi:hypothetical protein
VSHEINSLRQGNPNYKVSGSTLVAVVLQLRDGAAEGTIASIGDSRAYLVPAAGPARQLTRDHTYAEQLISRGVASAEAYKEKQALRLTFALGDALALDGVPDLFTDVRLEPGERLILCTDGICKHLSPEQLAKLARGAQPAQVAANIARAAIAAGSKDNVSAAVISYQPSTARGHQQTLWLAALLAAIAIAIGGSALYAQYGATLAPITTPGSDATVTPLPTTSTLLPNTSTPALMVEPTSTLAPSVTLTPTPTPTITETPTPRPTRAATRVPTNTGTNQLTAGTPSTVPTIETPTTEVSPNAPPPTETPKAP